MKATGIVRRIDDLGRVVIPKEIRRTMRIREGDPLEIFTNHEGEVIFKKYSAISEMSESAAQVADIMFRLASSMNSTSQLLLKPNVRSISGIIRPTNEVIGPVNQPKTPAKLSSLSPERYI